MGRDETVRGGVGEGDVAGKDCAMKKWREGEGREGVQIDGSRIK